MADAYLLNEDQMTALKEIIDAWKAGEIVNSVDDTSLTIAEQGDGYCQVAADTMDLDVCVEGETKTVTFLVAPNQAPP